MTQKEIVDLFLHVQLRQIENAPTDTTWLQMFTKTRITNSELHDALEALQKKWEQSLQYDDLMLRVARLEVERLSRL